MKWIYKNISDTAIYYRHYIFTKGKEVETDYPMPPNLGLICIQEGTLLDPILFQDNVLVKANTQREIIINAPNITPNISLTIFCLYNNQNIECKFNSINNKSLFIDNQKLQHIMAWELCSKIIFINNSEHNVHINVTALEVIN